MFQKRHSWLTVRKTHHHFWECCCLQVKLRLYFKKLKIIVIVKIGQFFILLYNNLFFQFFNDLKLLYIPTVANVLFLRATLFQAGFLKFKCFCEYPNHPFTHSVICFWQMKEREIKRRVTLPHSVSENLEQTCFFQENFRVSKVTVIL